MPLITPNWQQRLPSLKPSKYTAWPQSLGLLVVFLNAPLAFTTIDGRQKVIFGDARLPPNAVEPRASLPPRASLASRPEREGRGPSERGEARFSRRPRGGNLGDPHPRPSPLSTPPETLASPPPGADAEEAASVRTGEGSARGGGGEEEASENRQGVVVVEAVVEVGQGSVGLIGREQSGIHGFHAGRADGPADLQSPHRSRHPILTSTPTVASPPRPGCFHGSQISSTVATPRAAERPVKPKPKDHISAYRRGNGGKYNDSVLSKCAEGAPHVDLGGSSAALMSCSGYRSGPGSSSRADVRRRRRHAAHLLGLASLCGSESLQLSLSEPYANRHG
ncbi:hypothetical protein SKAU_G00070590 [Synaphobranchus kaupii]|uniref:Uncharacterized protein n=1 Tax=Synaphobranchus kaupii TaxID=118154 RepID=A0A9Q1G7T8_SYNKA|nr:hypothetical protein SKAU_G00070590 [Synaphobranchus kaupii]